MSDVHDGIPLTVPSSTHEHNFSLISGRCVDCGEPHPAYGPLRCDRYVGPDDPPGSLDFPWPVEENRCVLDRGHAGDHRRTEDRMIIALGTTGTAPDPPPVEIGADEALLVNAGAYRVVIKGDGSMHVIDDSEGDTVFEWPARGS